MADGKNPFDEWQQLGEGMQRVFSFLVRLLGAIRGHGPAITIVIFGTHVAKAAMCKIWDLLGYVLGDGVIQIIEFEQVMRHDGARGVPPGWGDNGSKFYDLLNPVIANRYIISVNPDSEEGRQVMYRILGSTDIFLTNQTEAALRKAGLDWGTLHRKFPTLVMAEGSFVGRTGPDAELPGIHHGGAFESGQASIADWHPGAPVNDTGYAGRLCLLALVGYFRRLHSGEGVRVEVGLEEWALETVAWQFGVTVNADVARVVWQKDLEPDLSDEEVLERVAEFSAEAVPFDAHLLIPTIFCPPCKRDKGGVTTISIGAVYPHHVVALFKFVGKEEMKDDPRFKTATDRMINRHELWQELNEPLSKMTESEIKAGCQKLGIPCGRRKTFLEVLRDPQILARRMVQEVEAKPGGKPLLVVGTAGHVNGETPKMQRARFFGEDTWYILKQMGWSDAEIVRLHDAKAVYCRNLAKGEKVSEQVTA